MIGSEDPAGILEFNKELLNDYERLFIDYADDSAWLRSLSFSVAVHNGEIHADDVACVALLSMFGWQGSLTRTRGETLLANSVRLDVGEGLLDHHGPRAAKGIAACTRVWQLLWQSQFQHFPAPVIKNSTVVAVRSSMDSIRAWQELRHLVDEIALADCGEAEPGFLSNLAHSYNLAVRTGLLKENEAFDRLVDIFTEVFAAAFIAGQQKEAADHEAEVIITSADDDPVLVFPESTRISDVKKLMFYHHSSAIYYVSPEKPDDWRVLCAPSLQVPYSPFSSKRLIPQRFRGLRGEELSKLTAIPGAIFCHQAGFIAGFSTRESAEAFARLCLTEQ